MTDPKPATSTTDGKPSEKKECKHCWGGGSQFRVCIICGAPDKEQREKPQWP